MSKKRMMKVSVEVTGTATDRERAIERALKKIVEIALAAPQVVEEKPYKRKKEECGSDDCGDIYTSINR